VRGVATIVSFLTPHPIFLTLVPRVEKSPTSQKRYSIFFSAESQGERGSREYILVINNLT